MYVKLSKMLFCKPKRNKWQETSGEEILWTMRLIYSGLTLWALLTAPNQGDYRAVIWTPLSWGGQQDVSATIKVGSQFAAVPVSLQMLRVATEGLQRSWLGQLVGLVARDLSLPKDPPSPLLGTTLDFLPLSPFHTHVVALPYMLVHTYTHRRRTPTLIFTSD